MKNRRLEAFFYNLKENKLALLALITILVLAVATSLAFLSPFDPNKINVLNALVKPNGTHWFGTDNLGRDYLARALYGGRISLLVGFTAMLISVTVGTLLGAFSGFMGGKVDGLIMRGVDILMSIPSFFLILIVNAYLEPGIKNVILVIGFLNWMSIARIVRAETLSVKEREYVLYSVLTGRKTSRILFSHIIPSILPTVIVAGTISIASAILMESSLSFLGLGVQQPDASWGSMLRDAQGYLSEAPYLSIFPGVLILITVLSFNFLGDVLRASFESKSMKR